MKRTQDFDTPDSAAARTGKGHGGLWQVDGNVTIATTRLSRRTIGLSDVD
jgi:hypothetical protein